MKLLKDHKVLIVRFSSIGDIVLTSPVVRCIKKQIGCEIHFITKSKFESTLEHNKDIDQLICFDREISECLPQLKQENYDLIIDLHKNLRSKRLIALLGARSISFDKINVQKWLRVHIKINFLPDLHLVDRYFNAIVKLGVTNDGEGLSYYHGINKDALNKYVLPNKYAVVVLGATYYTKRIPIEKLKTIFLYSRLKVVLLGGDDVEELGEKLDADFNNVINLAGKISLNESAAIVEGSQYVITGDTGLMHMAAAMKVPTIVFWGSTAIELGMYPYYGANHDIKIIHIVNKDISCSPCSKIGKDRCPKGHFKCMLQTSDQEIKQAIEVMGNIDREEA